jgi:hypothetical protein
MGLTVHYSGGRAASRDKIDECIAFLANVAQKLPCQYQIVDEKLTGILDDWSNPKSKQNGKPVSIEYKGISLFLDQGSEPLCFGFDYNTLEFCSYFTYRADGRLGKGGFFCKTQYAQNFLQTHHLTCKLLQRIQEKYVSDLKVSDDGEYFGNWDQDKLKVTFEEWSGIISAFGKAVDKLPAGSDSDIEQSIQKAAQEAHRAESLRKLLEQL